MKSIWFVLVLAFIGLATITSFAHEEVHMLQDSRHQGSICIFDLNENLDSYYSSSTLKESTDIEIPAYAVTIIITLIGTIYILQTTSVMFMADRRKKW